MSSEAEYSEEEYSEEGDVGQSGEDEVDEEDEREADEEKGETNGDEQQASANGHHSSMHHLRSTSIATGVSSSRKSDLGADIRRAYDLVCVFALISVALMIIEVELVTAAIVNLGFEYIDGASLPTIRTEEQADGTVMLPTNNDTCSQWIRDMGQSCGHVSNSEAQKLLKLMLLFTMVAQALSYKRYDSLYYKYLVRKNGQKAMDARKWQRRLWLFLDMLMGFVHVPFFMDKPFSMLTFRTYDGYAGPWPVDTATVTIELPYHMDMAAMFVVLPYRILLIPRFVLYHSKIWAQGSALASLASVEVGVGVAIRSGFARHPWLYIFFITAFPFVALSFIFSNCERLIEPIYGQHSHAFWASYVSLTTVVCVQLTTSLDQLACTSANIDVP